MKRAALPVWLLLAPLGAAAAGFDSASVGTSSAEFLKFGADARGLAMGQAMTAVADDSSAIYWNPAGLARMKERHAGFTHTALYQGVFCDFLSYAQPMGSLIGPERRELRPSGLGTVAGSLLYLNFGELQERDNTGAATGGAFTPQDFAATLGWGGTIAHTLDIGAAFKYIDARIQSTARTYAADAGARLHTYIAQWPWTLGVGAQNLGPGLKYHYALDPLPMSFRAGQSIEPVRGLIISSDMVFPRDNAPYPAVGGEGRITLDKNISIAVRAGWSNQTGDGLDGTKKMSFGVGLGYAGWNADYAWAPFGALGDIQRFSLAYRF